MNRIFSTPASQLRQLRRQAANPLIRHTEPALARAAPWLYQILDPSSPIVAKWNRFFLVTCLISLFIDPLYFFLPYVGGPACMSTDVPAAITITYFRTMADLFFVLHIVMKFRMAFVAPSSRVFGRGELVMDSHQIAVRYLKSDFIIDLAASLPLPQASSTNFRQTIWFIFIWCHYKYFLKIRLHSVFTRKKKYNFIPLKM